MVVSHRVPNPAPTSKPHFPPGAKPHTQRLLNHSFVNTRYDPAGNQTLMVDPAGNRTTVIYDALDRVAVVQDPLGHASSFAYDAASLLTSTTDRDGRVRN